MLYRVVVSNTSPFIKGEIYVINPEHVNEDGLVSIDLDLKSSIPYTEFGYDFGRFDLVLPECVDFFWSL